MRDQCVEAITRAAVAMGRKIKATDLRDIETQIIKAKKQLATQDREGWHKMSDAERLEKAAEKVNQDLISKGIKDRQRVERQMVAEAEKRAVLDKMETRLGKLEALQRFTWLYRDNKGQVQSVESRAGAISANLLRQLGDLWELEHGNLINLFTNRQAQMDLMSELYDKASGNPLAKKAADGYKAVTEKAVKDLNDMGFDIGLLGNYRSPQKLSFYRLWDATTPPFIERVGKSAKEIEQMTEMRRMELAKDMLPHVDRNMMVKPDGDLMTDTEALKFIDESLKTQLSGGMNKERGSGTGSMLAKRGSQERQLHWKSPESFMYIMEKYSDSNPVDMMQSALVGMGREMAMVEKFGPNAIDGFNTEIQRLADAGIPENKLRKETQLVEKFLGGGTDHVANPALDRYLQNFRQVMSSVFLGSSTLSQTVDQATMAATARAMNMPILDTFMSEARLMTSAEERARARSMGLGLETAAQMIGRLSDTGGAQFGAKATNAVLTLNLSNHLTNVVRQATGITVMNHIGNLSAKAKSLSELSAGDRMIMEARGLTDQQWGLFREAGKGEDGLTPDSIAALSDDAVLKLVPEKVAEVEAARLKQEAKAARLATVADQARQDAVYHLIGIALDESHMASVQPSFRAQHALDSVIGDSSILKLMTQFKSFPIAYFLQHVYERGLNGGHGVGNKWIYNASLMTASTVLGGVALMLGDIAAGRDPRETIDEEGNVNKKVMAQAFFKGGGLGIVGDLLNSDTWEGQDPLASQMGPGVGYAVNVAQLLHKTGHYLASESGSSDAEKARRAMGAEAATVLRSSIPGQNLWWSRAVFHNILLRDVNEFLSPGYQDRMRGLAEKNNKAGYWIGGDEGLRAPNMGNIIGQEQ